MEQKTYESPWISVVRFEAEDIMAASGTGGSSGGSDENQGEWDPQIFGLGSDKIF